MISTRWLVPALFVLGFGNGLSAQVQEPSAITVYTPAVDEHRFSLDSDRIITPRDPRLLIEGDAGATFEFHLVRSWPDSSSSELLYCIAYLGGLMPAPSLEDDTQAEPKTAPEPEIVDPYAEPRTASTPLGAAEDRGVAESAGLVFFPRYAFYISNDFFYLQTGTTLQRCELTEVVRERLKRRERVHFVLRLHRGRMLIVADGKFCGQFRSVELGDLTGARLLPEHELDQMVLGTEASAAEGRVSLYQELDGILELQTAGYDLDKWLRSFDGILGGVRFWDRALAEPYLTSIDGRPPLALRGFDHVSKNIAFGESGNEKASYADLVFFSDFSARDKRDHRVRVQWPLGGCWENSLLDPVPADAPPGLDDSYGNVEEVPLISIVRTASPAHWLVYEGAELVGLLKAEPGAERGVYTQDLKGGGVQIPVRIQPDELTFQLPEPGLLFGGDAREPAQFVTLRRPEMQWLSEPVDNSDPWWGVNKVDYINIPFRGFDITKMDPIYAYQGKTGSAGMIFDEPAENQWLLNSFNKVIPASFHYSAVDRAYGSTKTTVAQNEREFTAAYSAHKGSSTMASTYTTDKSTSERWQEMNAESESRFIAVTKSYAKKFALILNPAQARLSPEFVADCHELAERITSAEGDPRAACAEFIQTWGTHFAMGSVFGGMMVQNRVVEEGAIRDAYSEALAAEGKEWGGLPEGMGVGNYTVNAGKAGYEESFGWESSGGKSTGQSWTKGDVSYYRVPGDQLDPGEATAATVSEPVPLFFDLRPLDQLFTPVNFADPFLYHDVRVVLRDAIRDYTKKSVIPPGRTMKPWFQYLGRGEMQIRVKSVRVPSYVEGAVHLEPAGKPRQRRSMGFRVHRKDELNHRLYALQHKNGRKPEYLNLHLGGGLDKWMSLGVGKIRDLATKDRNRLVARVWVEGAWWMMPAGGRWSPPVRKPLRRPFTHRNIPFTRLTVGNFVLGYNEKYRDRWLAWLDRSLKKGFADRSTERFFAFKYGQRNRSDPMWYDGPQGKLSIGDGMRAGPRGQREITIVTEQRLRFVEDPIQPPELSSKSLQMYAEHVAQLSARQQGSDPRESISVRRTSDESFLSGASKSASVHHYFVRLETGCSQMANARRAGVTSLASLRLAGLTPPRGSSQNSGPPPAAPALARRLRSALMSQATGQTKPTGEGQDDGRRGNSLGEGTADVPKPDVLRLLGHAPRLRFGFGLGLG
jgi:hypothetical protein